MNQSHRNSLVCIINTVLVWAYESWCWVVIHIEFTLHMYVPRGVKQAHTQTRIILVLNKESA